MTFEYIASGLSFIWSNKFTKEEEPELCAKIREFTDKVVEAHPGHSYGVLFNAYTERGTAKHVNDLFHGYTIQADSGGLQMMTLGHGDIAESDKEKVYATQAEYSTVAMSFDQIPVKTISDKQGYLDAKSRYFDPSIFDECAIESGKNLAKQIQYFIDKKSNAKPLLIVQGNGLEWYQKWAELALKQVPKEHWDHISGVSSSSFALGNGLKEDIERVFAFSQLPVPDNMKKHCHLLGFGSMHRLIPAIQFRRSGLYSDDILFSYDSTKHTGGIARGQFQNGPGIAQLRRVKDKMYYHAVSELDAFFRDILNFKFNEEHFYDTIIQPASYWTEKYGERQKIFERNLFRYGFMLFSVHTVMNMVKKMEKNEAFMIKLRKRDSHLFVPLSKVKTLDDYNYWKNHVSRHMTSRKVKSLSERSSLDQFFDD